MKKYAILTGDEDGNCFQPLEPGAQDDLLKVMEDYGVEEWLEKHDDKYPENWPIGEAVLIEYEVKVPKKVKVVEEYRIE